MSLAQPSPDHENGTTPPENQDPEDLHVVGSSCESNMRKFARFFGCVILAVVSAFVIAALGVITLPVSVALLLVSIITYTVITVVSSASNKKNRVRLSLLTITITRSSTLVAVLLLLSLIFLFVVFRVHSSLKHRTIAGLEVWKWLEISLVSCIFCTIWMGGCFIVALVHREYDYKENLVYFTSKLRRIINCICFIVGELLVLRVAPTSKKRVIIFGLGLWKWILVLVSLICGWYVIQVVTHVLVLSLQTWQDRFWKERDGDENRVKDEMESKNRLLIKKYAVFLAKGFRTRINILLFFVLIAETWIFYVETRLQLEHESENVKQAFDFVIRTFLSLLIAAALSVIESILLLLWEARELYKRFKKRIIESYMHLYILAKLCGSGWEMFHIWYTDSERRKGGTGGDERSPEDDGSRRSVMSAAQDVGSPISVMSGAQDVGSQRSVRSTGGRSGSSFSRGFGRQESVGSTDTDGRSASSTGGGSKRTDKLDESQKEDQQPKQMSKKERVDKDANVKLEQILEAAISKFVSYDILKRIAKLFLDAEATLASDKVEQLRLKWEEIHRESGRRDRPMTRADLRRSINELYECKLEQKSVGCLYQQLVEGLDTERDHVQYKDFENWLKKAHNSCVELGNTLAGAYEVVTYLEKIMIGILIAVSIVIWLFLTRIATTQLIVLMASPILAATFIFGETAKTIFQGIIFTFAVHPFDVGDVCVIEGNQLEVKKIGIWKSTFYMNGNKDEEVMYPNSILITTPIVKHTSNMDLHDSIEFTVQFKLDDYATEDKAIDRLIDYIEAHMEENPNNFESGFHELMVKEIGEAIKMVVQFKHKKNVQFMTYLECLRKKNETRSKLSREIRKLISKVREEFQKGS